MSPEQLDEIRARHARVTGLPRTLDAVAVAARQEVHARLIDRDVPALVAEVERLQRVYGATAAYVDAVHARRKLMTAIAPPEGDALLDALDAAGYVSNADLSDPEGAA